MKGDGTPLRRNSRGEILASEDEEEDEDAIGEAVPPVSAAKRLRLKDRSYSALNAGTGRGAASSSNNLSQVREFRPVMIVDPETGNVEPYINEDGEMVAEEEEDGYDQQEPPCTPPPFHLPGNPGLGINMGYGHLGHHGHIRHRSGHTLLPTIGRAGDYMNHQTLAYSHGLAQANAAFAAQLATGGAAGPFLSPGIPYSEPAMEGHFAHHERAFSVGSGHSACSAPPVLQQQHDVFVSPSSVHSTPAMTGGVARNLEGMMQDDGIPLVPITMSECNEQQVSPTSSLFQSPSSSYASSAAALNARKQQAMQAQYHGGQPQQQVLFNAQGIPTMMINYAPPAHEPAYPQLQSAANHLTANHHSRQGQQYYVNGMPVHAGQHLENGRQSFVPQGLQPAFEPAGMETMYPTPPTSSQSQFVSQFAGSPATDLVAPKMYLSASHPGFQHVSPGGAAGEDEGDAYLEDMDADGDLTPSAHIENERHALAMSTVLVDDLANGPLSGSTANSFRDQQQHFIKKQRSASPANHFTYFQQQNANIAASSAASAKYLQAPALARSYSSPIMPLRYMSQQPEILEIPSTPAMTWSSTFDSLYGQPEDVKPQFVSGSALVSGMTVSN